MKIQFFSTVLVALLPAVLNAHEFWISPESFTLSKGTQVHAQVRSGEYFQGSEFPFMPDRIVSANLHNTKGKFPLTGVAGSTPAINFSQPQLSEGLQIISYQSTGTNLVHTDFEEFLNYLREDGLQWVEQAHTDREIAKDKFVEMFTRYTRSLVAVSDDVTGAAVVPWQDRTVGLPYELLVMNQPWANKSDTDITLQLLADGRPVVDTQVTVFNKTTKDEFDKSPLKIRTNQDGIVVIPRNDGGEFLASAVVMKPGVTTAWHSHWVSTTFALD